MGFLSRLIVCIDKVGERVGAVFLFAMTALTVVTVLGRSLGVGIPGSYELLVLFVVAPVAFALLRTTLEEGHVAVNSLVDRLPQRPRAVFARLAWLVTFVGWSLIAWSALDRVLKVGLRERTEILEVPYLPFRIAWVLGLVLVCVAALMRFFGTGVRKGERP